MSEIEILIKSYRKRKKTRKIEMSFCCIYIKESHGLKAFVHKKN